MSYAINLTFQLLVWLVPGEKFYGLGTGFQFQTIPVPLYVLNHMGLLCIPVEQSRCFVCLGIFLTLTWSTELFVPSVAMFFRVSCEGLLRQ